MKKIVFSFSFFLIILISLVSSVSAFSLNYEGTLIHGYGFSWRGDDYNVKEQIIFNDNVIDNANIFFDFSGESLTINEGDLVYEYVFDDGVDLSSAGGKGTIPDPEYTYPINIKLVGKTFHIVGIGTNKIKMLYGTMGSATPTSPVTYGDYSIYSDVGFSDSWARIRVKDASGNIVVNTTLQEGENKTLTETGFAIKLLNVAALQDGTVVGADLIAGEPDEMEKTYSAPCSISNTGPDTRFPGETEWCIQFLGGSADGKINKSDKIQVVFKPSAPKTVNAGDILWLPNNYGKIAFSKSCEGVCVGSRGECIATCVGGYCAGYGCDPNSISPCCCVCPQATTTSTTSTTVSTTTTIPTTTTTTTAACSCSDWYPGECGESDCTAAERYYWRLCTPSSCELESKCVSDSSCGITTTITMPTTTTTPECQTGCIYKESCLSFGTRVIISGVPSYCDIDRHIKAQKSDNTECQNSYECKSNKCEDGICKTGCDGCLYNKRCLPIGTRKGVLYCSLEREMTSQKSGGESCENSFECASNSCVDNQCVKLGTIQAIIRWFLLVFGI